ncbi:MAG: DUF1330 domain-containing protein [Ilumatobacteraceae bacterium]
MHVTRTDEQWDLLAEADPNVPIVLLNLIRYRDHALDGYGCDGMTGEQAYAEYGRRLQALASGFPGTPFWVGEAETALIAPAGETWDLVLFVGYDSVSTFREMIASAAYQNAATARSAAVEDSRLILMHQTSHAGDAMTQWARSAESESAQPIVMLNLIRYRDAALEGHTCDGMTGEEAYVEYLRRLAVMDHHDFPGTIIWDGTAVATIIGPSDEDWDRVLLAAYSSVDEFRRMAQSDAYQTASPARTAGVLDSRLVLMHQNFPRS